ncbi:MAG: YqaJ viral recombinase family protein [Candidatus Micrarchaeota archaeon]|nr:YqaJ viral recombinase family protein [Candidatus Micrarchaeota archaeon]
MSHIQVSQRSDEWFKLRCGSLGASQIADALARTKSGYGASRYNVMAQLIAERMTGMAQEGYTNAAMQRGIEVEPEARDAYAFLRGVEVSECGMFTHPEIPGTHASPDGLIAEDGLLELKCPNTATHIETLLSGKVPGKYYQQIMWQLACSGRKWCDFVSYDNRMPGNLMLFVQRIERDDDAISELETGVRDFLVEMQRKIEQLEALRSQS